MLETVTGFQLSPQQARLWLLQERDAGTAYRSHCLVRLRGDVQPQLLEAAVCTVVRRHEILRTCFRSQPGMFLPIQVVTDHTPELRRLDFSDLCSQEQDTAIEGLFAATDRRRFDDSDDLLLDSTLVTLSPVEHVLLISLPSLCADQKSLEIMVREIMRAYAGDAIVEEPAQYAVVSQWLNDL